MTSAPPAAAAQHAPGAAPFSPPAPAPAPVAQTLSEGGGFFGARFSLYPMSDRFVPIILHAIEGLKESGLEVETDDVSTFLGGPPDAVFGALQQAFARAAESGEHVVMTVLFSYGCPGETVCLAPEGGTQIAAGPSGAVRREPETQVDATSSGDVAGREGTAVRVAGQWSLYPLGVPHYMDVIYREIDRTKTAGVFTRGQHFVSRLDGDLGAVLGAIRRGFLAACESTGHVVAHATLSANSPSGTKRG